jgi:hypothetical protein
MAKSASARTATRNRAFLSGQPWLDANGKRIEAHGGGLLLHEGVYWWYGEDHAHGLGNKTGIHCYSSTDLLNWSDHGIALPAEELPEQYRAKGACERPKVLYNAATRKFVMWAHLDGGNGYSWAEAGIAVADAPQGPFKLVRRGRPIQFDMGLKEEDWTEQKARGPTYRDMALFQDDDGSAYVFYAAEGNPTMYVSRLRADFQWVEEPQIKGKSWERILIKLEREAPAPFRHNGKYHLLSSACTGWGPNPGMHAIADSPLGPWRVVGDPCRGHEAETTYRSQPTYVLPAPGKPAGSFIYLADRWEGHQLETSTYVWLPFVVGDDQRVQLDFHDRWDLSVFDAPAAMSLPAPKARAVERGRSLSWAAVKGAQSYRVYRNGQHLGSTSSTRFELPPVLSGRAHAYAVVATALRGRWSAPSKPVVLDAPPARDGWLSEYEPDSWKQGWGTMRRDFSTTQDRLRIGKREYQRGIGTHAVSEIVYRLSARYAAFEALVGLSHPHGLVDFKVYGDGRLLASSGTVRYEDEPQRLRVDLAGVHDLRLVVDEAGKGHDYGHANWCDARLLAKTPKR